MVGTQAAAYELTPATIDRYAAYLGGLKSTGRDRVRMDAPDGRRPERESTVGPVGRPR